MGYTVVSAFTPESYATIENILSGIETNKIPFGRDCDRDEANKILRYHVTLFHWGKQLDKEYLPLLEKMPFHNFSLLITGTNLMYAEEGSLLLYFEIADSEQYRQLKTEIYEKTGIILSDFLHMTITADKDHEKVRQIRSLIDSRAQYPYRLDVSGMDVYHIWRPVYLLRTVQ